MPYQGLFIPTAKEKYVGDPTKIVYRSGWEKKFFVYCDTNPAILRWASEEFSIPYQSPVDHRPHRYFPDVWLEAQTTTGPRAFLIEIKPKSQTQLRSLKRPSRKLLWEATQIAINHAKWDAAKALCETKGWTFLVVTEDDLFKKGFGRVTR